jgi:opine dehydrogenase
MTPKAEDSNMTAEMVKEADSRRKRFIKEFLDRNKKDLKFCVIGAGHGGLAMAGHLALMGVRVRLFNRSYNKIRPLIHRPSIRLEGEIQGDGPIELDSSHIEECLHDVNIIMVVVPANGHRYIAQTCASHLKEQQVVILNPGRTGGTLEFLQAMRECGATEFPFLAEAQTFIYTARAIGPTQARIFAIKYAVPLASLLAYWIPGIVKIINRVYPLPKKNRFFMYA